MNKISRGLLIALLFGATHQALAQDVFIYPNKGQSAEQQEQDKFNCYSWAKANTGFDPVNATSGGATQAPQAGQMTGGVARGALGGATIGVIAGDSSKAAGRGAVAGALFGGIRQSRVNQQVQRQQQVGQSNTNQNDYNRAYAACLEGRGYTVK
ncbi:MAG: hypothetical protein WCD50_05225 [Onishia taeanensis]|uniref:hypothetical protein n=1 Tax=Onishia taeanensis TaxID=284577 RepID=UPI003C7CCCE3